MVHPINQLQSPTTPNRSMLHYMKNLESHMKLVQQQQATNHKAMASLNGSFHLYALQHSSQSTWIWPSVEEFDSLAQWPGDKTVFAAHSEENHAKTVLEVNLFLTRSPLIVTWAKFICHCTSLHLYLWALHSVHTLIMLMHHTFEALECGSNYQKLLTVHKLC